MYFDQANLLISFCGMFGVESERILSNFRKHLFIYIICWKLSNLEYKQRSGLGLFVEESREFVSESDTGKLAID